MNAAVTTVAAPAGHQLLLPSPDFVDAYRVALPAAAPASAAAVTYALLGQAPAWVGRLLRLRDALVGPLGLRTFPARGQRPPTLRPGTRFGPFQVLGVTAEEVLLGQDDWHLDFRVAVRRLPDAAVVTTAVRCHHWLGRLYFALIRPFHRRIVPAMLRHGRRHLPAAPASLPA